ncbi:hypothetical protein [Methylomicrobium lacus]|uniref:hypothetical protein n=1 Tax=Methylomicrobium lacus TaxID=136992 RepID=UPI0035A8ECA7
MAKKKSSFYQTRFHIAGLNEDRAAELIGVPVEEIRQWDKEGAPAMAEKLLLLWDRKHVGHEDWDDWLFSRGVLRFKNRRWTPKRILELTGTLRTPERTGEDQNVARVIHNFCGKACGRPAENRLFF